VCGKTRKAGRFKLKRITDSKRMRAKLRALKGEIERRRHQPIPQQAHWLANVLRGHYQYYAVPENIEAVRAFRRHVVRHWLRALGAVASAPRSPGSGCIAGPLELLVVGQ
jgi:RNA-directed DNA polymerase